ncbi:MAG: hypothetical protein Q4F72_00260 [Desulfovibrionaceae bacterium]|nr:hypothetical protein [Desulfovibrionaceae bacterium]
MLVTYLSPLTSLYDALNEFWESQRTQRAVAAIILLLYFAALAGIELKNWGVLPPWLAAVTPNSHSWAILMAFTLILGVEVISLIFCISDSFSRSVGKQLEILALIQLRGAFKELGALQEPITIANHWEPVLHIALAAAGALLIFIALRVFMRLSGKRMNTHKPTCIVYVYSKKLLCLMLLGVVVVIGVMHTVAFFQTGQSQRFFETVYTALIFADITLVLLAQRYMPAFNAVFRNSGFVVGTLMMRLSLSAAAPLDTLIALFSAGYVIVLVWSFNHFLAEREYGRTAADCEDDKNSD